MKDFFAVFLPVVLGVLVVFVVWNLFLGGLLAGLTKEQKRAG